jgi:DNA-binding protein HU-beta
MTKAELVEAIAAGADITKVKAEAALKAALEAITAALKKGDSVQLTGFGTFAVRKRGARTGRNPATGETIQIKASKVPSFRAGKQLKDAVK